jgi:crotonobetainyl-CoA:carnitine CoA-transferase CaiB-like acyl-CoA transferase
LQDAGVTAGALVRTEEIPANPQLRARRYHRVLAHAVVGSQRYPRPPVTFSFGDLVTGPAPTLGEHTAAVLGAAGVDAATIAAALGSLAAGEARLAES